MCLLLGGVILAIVRLCYENTPSSVAKSMFYYIESAGHFFCDPTYFTDRINYDSFLLLYTIKGSGCLKYRNLNYLLKPNQIFLIDCMETQYYCTQQDDEWDLAYLHFNGSKSKKYFERIYGNNGPVYSLEKSSTIVENIVKIIELLKLKDKKVDIVGSCLITEILTELLLRSSNESLENNVMPNCVKTSINFIEENFFTPLDLDILSHDSFISKYHLSRLFKKHTGYSPYEYLIKYRLTQAKIFLKSSTLTINEISKRVGFESTSHFIKIFGQHEKTSPMKFRNYWKY